MENADIERWRSAVDALESTDIRLNRAINVVLGEAVDVAQFHERFWKTVYNDDGEIVREGLEEATGGHGSKALLHENTAEELRSLEAAATAADTAYRLALSRRTAAPVQEARRVLSRLTGGLRWLLDDDVEERADVQLANLDARHKNPITHDDVASALNAYSSFANTLRDRLGVFGAFKLEWIDQAKTLADTLREASGARRTSDEAREALRMRDGLFVLIRQRVRVVRQAVDFVFAEMPEIAAEFPADRRRRVRRDEVGEVAAGDESDDSGVQPGASPLEEELPTAPTDE